MIEFVVSLKEKKGFRLMVDWTITVKPAPMAQYIANPITAKYDYDDDATPESFLKFAFDAYPLVGLLPGAYTVEVKGPRGTTKHEVYIQHRRIVEVHAR